MRLTFSCFLCILVIHSHGQSTFSKNIDIDGYADVASSISVVDQGFVVTVSSLCNNSQSQCFSVITLDQNGEITNINQYQNLPWNIQHGNSTGNTGVAFGKDGSMYFSGDIENSGGAFDVFLLKTDAQGDSIWLRVYDMPFNDVNYTVLSKTDSTLLLFSESSALQVDDEIWLLEVDFEGNKVWEGFYGQEFNSVARQDITKLENGDIAFSYLTCDGLLSCGSNFPLSMTVTRINPIGEEIWTSTFASFEGIVGSHPFSELVALDNGKILVSHRRDDIGGFRRPPILIWLDPDGNVTQQYDFPNFTEFQIADLMMTSSGIIVGAGFVDLLDYDLGFGGWVFAFTQDGEMLWERFVTDLNFPAKSSWFNAIDELENGGFILSGVIKTENGDDVWLVKLDSVGCFEPNCGNGLQMITSTKEHSILPDPTFKVYPNPVGNEYLLVENIHGSLLDPGLKINIMDSIGSSIISLPFSNRVNISNLPAGVYFLQIFSQTKGLLQIEKLIVQPLGD